MAGIGGSTNGDEVGGAGTAMLFDGNAVGQQLQQETRVELGNLSLEKMPTSAKHWELRWHRDAGPSTDIIQSTSRGPERADDSDKANGKTSQPHRPPPPLRQQHSGGFQTMLPNHHQYYYPTTSPSSPRDNFWREGLESEHPHQDWHQNQYQAQNRSQHQDLHQGQYQDQHQHQDQHQDQHQHQDQDQNQDQYQQYQQHSLASNFRPQLHHLQPRQRLRQGSLASDWRYPYMHSSPRSPTNAQPPSTLECGRDELVSPGPWSPTRSLRQRRGLQNHQNTDPLVYHRLISSDPVNTRLAQSSSETAHWKPPNLSSLSYTNIKHSPQLPPSSPGHIPPTFYDQDPVYGETDPNEASTGRRAVVEPPANARPPYDPLPFDGARSGRDFPITPVSPTVAGPRWDSLASSNIGPNNRTPPAAIGLATTANAPIIPDSNFPPSPLRSPKSPTFSNSLYAHPFIPEDETLDLNFDTSRHEQAVPITTTSGQSTTMYRPDSRQSGETAHSIDNYNFSHPRRPSLRSLNHPDFSGNPPFRPGTGMSIHSDSLRLESRIMTSAANPNNYMPYSPYNTAAPRRQPSVGSNMSSSTHMSVTPSLQHKPSQDRLGAHRNVSQNAATGHAVGLPHANHPQAPPRYYNRGPLAPTQQSHIYEDEMRSSLRSHLTTSTAQETLFTEPERSSVMTKSSSVLSSSFRNTRQSSFFGPHTPSLDVRDSLSVDDVMGMYVNGFNDSDMDLARRMSGIELDRPEMPVVRLGPGRMADHDDSRPGSAVSHNDDAANRLLEAMSQTKAMPIPGRSFPLNGDGTVVLRDKNEFFRKSLASSLPKDMRLSFISTTSKMEQNEDTNPPDDVELETDSTRHSRHDSGKMVDPRSEQNSPKETDKADASLLAVADATSLPNNNSLSPQAMLEKPAAQPTPSVPIQGAAQPEDLDPDANDRYGFRKSNQYITRDQYDQWNGQYSEYLARRRKKWESFLKENGLMTDQPNRFPQHSAKAKRFVRKGIPPDWRGAAWFYYAGGPKILANNQGVYEQTVKRAASGQLKDVCRDDIERDLYRTFPDNVRFRRTAMNPPPGAGSSPNETPGHSRNNSTQSANPQPRAPGSEPEIIAQLRRVLSAFAVFNPSIGYCQSLNFLGGMLLLFVESEEQAFWLLNIITRVYLPGTHEMSLEGSKVDLSVLMHELQEVLPNVWTKISDDGSSTVKKKSRRHRKGAQGVTGDNLPPVTLALTAWFMSCFIGTLPVETTLRVWDVFFYEGSKTLFRVALSIFKAGENEIKAINDPMEVFAVVQSLPRKMLDANTLMEICFKRRSGLNHLTSEVLDEKRAERKEQLHVERKEAVAAAAANPGIQTAATIAVGRTKNASDLLSVNSGDSNVRRKHTLFGRRHKDRGLSDV